jgi:gamma-glutamyltranspeptidase/glutathione hydrolase
MIISSCQSDTSDLYGIQKVATSNEGMVVSPHPLATKAGVQILEQGGNAFDAIVAVEFAKAVVYPRAGNIGGGGFMISRHANGDIHVLDYREKAPAKAHRDMYLDQNGNVIPDLSIKGHLAAGVPGSVDGLLEILDSLGSGMPLSQILEPAFFLAENGYRLTPRGASGLKQNQAVFKSLHPKFSPFLKDLWEPGQVFKQIELAGTLKRIMEDGRAGFYEGLTAQLIVTEMNRLNGIMSLEDLKNYHSVWREPIRMEYDDYSIISMPPPSSGGIALVQLMDILEPMDLSQSGFHSVETLHAMIEAERRVYADRASHLGDPDFVDVPMETLIDIEYLNERMSDFNPDYATRSDSVHSGNLLVPVESDETTHTCVVDDEGNTVSITSTLNSSFGSKAYVTGAGFLLNNEMDDFSVKPGVPNQFGLLGNEYNAIEPGKRMLSSMTPTIVERDGEFFMTLGTPGGGKIITTVFQVLMNVIEFGMPLDSAVFAPRFHHQWYPDTVFLERGKFQKETIAELENMGHRFDELTYFGYIKAVMRLPDGTLMGVGDNRSEDHAEGIAEDK